MKLRSAGRLVGIGHRWKLHAVTLVMAATLMLFGAPAMEVGTTPASATGTTVYIDPTWSGCHDGSLSCPYQSWSDIASWTAGNSYLQKRGTSWSGPQISVGADNVTLGAYGTGSRPVIDSTAVWDTANNIRRFGISTSHAGLTVQDLEITAPLATSAILLSGDGADNATINNDVIHDSYYGVRAEGTRDATLSGISGFKALNTEIYDIQEDGMWLGGLDSPEIGSMTIRDVNQKWHAYPGPGDCPETACGGDGVQIDGPSGTVYIHDSTVDKTDNGNKFCFIVGNSGLYHFNVTFERNTCLAPVNKGTSGLFLYASTGTATIRYNRFDNGLNGVYSHMKTVNAAYNVFEHTGTGSSSDVAALSGANDGGQSGTSLTAYNNVFYDAKTAIHLQSGWASVTSKNNAVYLTSSAQYAYKTRGTPAPTVVSDYNDIYPAAGGTAYMNGASLSGWQTSTSQDSHSMLADPLFVNAAGSDFRLQGGSPAINAGTAVGISPDDYGTAVPQGGATDIGIQENASAMAWEFASGLEGWIPAGGASGLAWASGGYANGSVTGSDPRMYSPDSLNANILSSNKVLKVRMKNGTSSSTAEIFFQNAGDTTFVGNKTKSFAIIPNDPNYTEYTIDMSGVADWTGTLKRLRLDPSIASSGTFSIDYIRLQS